MLFSFFFKRWMMFSFLMGIGVTLVPQLLGLKEKNLFLEVFWERWFFFLHKSVPLIIFSSSLFFFVSWLWRREYLLFSTFGATWRYPVMLSLLGSSLWIFGDLFLFFPAGRGLMDPWKHSLFRRHEGIWHQHYLYRPDPNKKHVFSRAGYALCQKEHFILFDEEDRLRAHYYAGQGAKNFKKNEKSSRFQEALLKNASYLENRMGFQECLGKKMFVLKENVMAKDGSFFWNPLKDKILSGIERLLAPEKLSLREIFSRAPGNGDDRFQDSKSEEKDSLILETSKCKNQEIKAQWILRGIVFDPDVREGNRKSLKDFAVGRFFQGDWILSSEQMDVSNKDVSHKTWMEFSSKMPEQLRLRLGGIVLYGLWLLILPFFALGWIFSLLDPRRLTSQLSVGKGNLSWQFWCKVFLGFCSMYLLQEWMAGLMWRLDELAAWCAVIFSPLTLGMWSLWKLYRHGF